MPYLNICWRYQNAIGNYSWLSSSIVELSRQSKSTKTIQVLGSGPALVTRRPYGPGSRAVQRIEGGHKCTVGVPGTVTTTLSWVMFVLAKLQSKIYRKIIKP